MPKNEAVPKNWAAVLKNVAVGCEWGQMVEIDQKMG